MRRAAPPLQANHRTALKTDFISLLSSASSRGSDKGLFFSQWDVGGRQSAHLIQRGREGGMGGT